MSDSVMHDVASAHACVIQESPHAMPPRGQRHIVHFAEHGWHPSTAGDDRHSMSLTGRELTPTASVPEPVVCRLNVSTIYMMWYAAPERYTSNSSSRAHSTPAMSL